MSAHWNTRFPPDRALWLILLIAVALRLWIAPQGAHPGDLPVLMRWARTLRDAGWLSIYAASDANYPPLGMALIGLAQAAFDGLFPAAPLGGPVWLILIKLPAILADLLLIAAVYPVAPTRARARLIALSLALNPALILMSAWWGQLDSVYADLVIVSVIAALRGSPATTGLAFGAALMTKQQAIFFTSVILGAVAMAGKDDLTIKTTDLRTEIPHRSLRSLWFNLPIRIDYMLRFTIAALIPVAAALIPFFMTGQGVFLLHRMTALVSGPNWPTINALNLWYLLTGGAGNWEFNAPLTLPDTTALIAGLTYRQIGIALLIGWLALIPILAQHAHRSDAWLLAGALTALGIFLLPTQAHERYSLAAVGFAAAYCAALRVSPPPRFRGRGLGGGVESGPLIRISPVIDENSLNNHVQPPVFLWKSDVWYAIITGSIVTNLIWAASPLPWLELALDGSVLAGGRGIGLVIAATMTLLTLIGGSWLAALIQRQRGEEKPDHAGSTN